MTFSLTNTLREPFNNFLSHGFFFIRAKFKKNKLEHKKKLPKTQGSTQSSKPFMYERGKKGMTLKESDQASITDVDTLSSSVSIRPRSKGQAAAHFIT